MPAKRSVTRPSERREFLVRLMVAVHAAIGGTIAFVLGGAVLAPAFTRKPDNWLRTTALEVLPENRPFAVTLRVARQDGFTHVVDRTVVYLLRTGEHDVRAMHSTCTHLGCRTSYDAESNVIVCPCHGGLYDAQGNVIDGPPPTPLPQLKTRVENGYVMVQV